MKHLQKAKKVTAKIFYAGNGHCKGVYQFDCGLDAKRFVEQMASSSSKSLYVIIEDAFNTLYQGDGRKV
jgi:hypothetical protein